VQYRDVTVGTVASLGRPLPGGVISVVLHMKPSRITAVPASVRATVGPLSVFGNQSIQLEAPSGPSGGATLKAGQTIPAIESGTTASLQATLADLDTVLNAIHPAQLEVALTELATALRGQGQLLGDTLSQSSTYLGLMLPYLPDFEADMALLGPVSNNFAASTPAFLSLLSNFSVTAQTLTADQAQVHQSLVGAATLSGQFSQVLTTIQTPFEHLVADFGPLLADISHNPNTIAQTLQGLDSWSKAWTAAESQGPFLSTVSTVSIPNPADAILASLGATNANALFAIGVGTNLVNPPTYTTANCPVYGTEVGHCPAAASAPATPAAAFHSATNALMPEPQQSQAVSAIAAGLDHGTPSASAAVSTLLLGPLLQAMAG
jgi:virulence factor Mce-like protein